MIGLGSMRVTDAAVIDAAIDAGVDLIDTADAYENEALVARAIASRAVKIVTKGGLVRPGGAWVPDGRASHLAAAARASLARLGAIDLYLLHAIDPRVPLATSVRAIDRLRDDGVVRGIGVSNVNLAQLDEALAIAPAIEAVEVELSPWRLDALRGGVVAACERRGLTLLAHRPLGGAAGVRRLSRVAPLAESLGLTPAELALAWLRAKSPAIVPLPGATRIETARSAARAQTIALDRDVVARLDELFEISTVRPERAAARGESKDVVLIMGIPAAGKSTLAASYVDRGYLRFNRDERGGSLAHTHRALDAALADGAARAILDNTYVNRAARAPVIELARRHGARVTCIHVATPLEDAQTNACARMLARYGRLLEPDEIKRIAKKDPGTFGPHAQFRWRREHEAPSLDEGFDAIEIVTPPRAISGGDRAAIFVTLDQAGLHAPSAIPDDVLLVGLAWLPDVPSETWDALADRTRALVGREVVLARCPHAAGPPVCWCRKPLPGLGLAIARAHAIDLSRSLVVGRGAADRGFAERLGIRYGETLSIDV
ncbi:MAG TPA: aldo/keto reductase [Kofleriaceae bacterium]|nr:aldo/keto reductase [Kofleriaceae bacterium]